MAGKECIDCKEERIRRGQPEPAPSLRRPVVAGGPRTPLCFSHDKQRKRERKAGVHERRVQQTYGLGAGDYGRLYLSQGRRCAICGRANGATRKLSVDHDHATGLVRGLLCRPCNDILGHLRDDPEAARRMVNYLLDPPAVRLGIRAVHRDNRGDGAA